MDLVQNQVFQKFLGLLNSKTSRSVAAATYVQRTSYIVAAVLIYPGLFPTLVGFVKYSLTVFKLFIEL